MRMGLLQVQVPVWVGWGQVWCSARLSRQLDIVCLTTRGWLRSRLSGGRRSSRSSWSQTRALTSS